MRPLTKYGGCMYTLCEKTGLFFSKHLWLYWILVFTWALPTTLIGLLVTLVLLITKHKPEKYGHSYRFLVGDWWGGLTLGLMFIQDKTKNEDTAKHEYGHVHQIILGPFLLPLVIIPSAVRYWYQRLISKNKSRPYDEIWFERSATEIGYQIVTGNRKYYGVEYF